MYFNIYQAVLLNYLYFKQWIFVYLVEVDVHRTVFKMLM